MRDALAQMDSKLSASYKTDIKGGSPSIVLDKLVRAMLLQVLYSVGSKRLLVEQIQYNLFCPLARRSGQRRRRVELGHWRLEVHGSATVPFCYLRADHLTRASFKVSTSSSSPSSGSDTTKLQASQTHVPETCCSKSTSPRTFRSDQRMLAWSSVTECEMLHRPFALDSSRRRGPRVAACGVSGVGRDRLVPGNT